MKITVTTTGNTYAEMAANLMRIVANMMDASAVNPSAPVAGDFGYYHNGSYTVEDQGKPAVANDLPAD